MKLRPFPHHLEDDASHTINTHACCMAPAVLLTGTQYRDEHDLPIVMDLIAKDLSEPYSIFTYR